MHGQMGGWMDEWINVQMDGWADGWTGRTSVRSVTDHFTEELGCVLLKDSPALQMAFCISGVTQFPCS